MSAILIVEDDDNLRESIADVLTDSGYETTQARNGREALAKLTQRADFDVILSDLKMPEMDGMTLLQTLRDHHPDIAVIILTGYGTVDTAVQAMREGAVNYLLKPMNNRQLLKSVEEALAVRQTKVKQKKLVDQVVSGLQALGITEHSEIQDALRQGVEADPPRPVDDRFLRVRDLIIDQHRLVAMFEGKPLELTPTEFEILYCMMQMAGRVVTFEDIVYRLQGVRVERDEARTMLSTHISNLRTKLRKAGCSKYLVNSRGHGYFINIDG